MLLTEDEAKRKRCQESFGDGWVSDDILAAPMPDRIRAVVSSPSHCIGSACMAWRWSARWQKKAHDIPMNPSEPVGYCGKGGPIHTK